MSNQRSELPLDHLEAALRLARRTLRHAGSGVLVCLVGIALSAALVTLRHRNFLSSAILRYEEGAQWEARTDGARRVGQQLREIALSRTRLQQLVHDLDLFPELVRAGRIDDALEEMRRRVTFRVNEGDSYTVGYAGRSADQAQRVAAAMADQAIRDNAELQRAQFEGSKDFLDEQRSRSEQSLLGKETELARFLAQHPEYAQPGAGTAPVTRAGEDTLPRLPAQPQGVVQAEPRPDPTREPVAGPPAELVAAVHQAEAQLSSAQREYAELSKRYTDVHPTVVAALEAVRNAQASRQRAVDALKAATPLRQETTPAAPRAASPSAAAPPPPPGPRRPALSVGTVAVLNAEYARLTREVAEERDRLQRLETRQFAASMASTSLNTGRAARLTIIDPAFLPTRPTGASRTLLLAAGLAFSVLMGLGVAFLRAVIDDRVLARQDVERFDFAPVLVEIPRVRRRELRGKRGGATGRNGVSADPVVQQPPLDDPFPELTAEPRGLPPHLLRQLEAWINDEPPPTGSAAPASDADQAGPIPPAAPSAAAASVADAGSNPGATSSPGPGPAGKEAKRLEEPARSSGSRSAEGRDGDPRLILFRAPDSMASARFRVLRHRLVERGAPRMLLVTSPRTAEGKSTCALNLALALCEGGRSRVLLVEANLRRPALAHLLAQIVGDRAASEPSPQAGAQPWGLVQRISPWLHVAPGITHPYGRRLDPFFMRARLEQLRNAGYETIVIDGPPILGSADVNVLEESVDGILLTLRRKRSHMRDLRDAIEQVGPQRVLGVVLMPT